MNHRLCVLTLCLAACGDALAGDGYAGEPLAEFGGSITTQEGLKVPPDLRVAVLWHTAVEPQPAGASLPAEPLLSNVDVDGSGKLAHFAVSLRDLPPPESLIRRDVTRPDAAVEA